MQPEQVCSTLNENAHRGYHVWYFDKYRSAFYPLDDDANEANVLDKFEGEAVASKYTSQREVCTASLVKYVEEVLEVFNEINSWKSAAELTRDVTEASRDPLATEEEKRRLSSMMKFSYKCIDMEARLERVLSFVSEFDSLQADLLKMIKEHEWIIGKDD